MVKKQKTEISKNFCSQHNIKKFNFWVWVWLKAELYKEIFIKTCAQKGGTEVIAGTTNGNGALKIKVTQIRFQRLEKYVFYGSFVASS